MFEELSVPTRNTTSGRHIDYALVVGAITALERYMVKSNGSDHNLVCYDLQCSDGSTGYRWRNPCKLREEQVSDKEWHEQWDSVSPQYDEQMEAKEYVNAFKTLMNHTENVMKVDAEPSRECARGSLELSGWSQRVKPL